MTTIEILGAGLIILANVLVEVLQARSRAPAPQVALID